MDDTPAAPPAFIEPDPSVYDDAALTPLHPNHVKVLRIQAAVIALPLLLGGFVLEGSGALPLGVVIVPLVLLALLAVVQAPLRRYHAKGYAMGEDRLRVVRGLLFRSDSVVPFGRVQHIDLDQGPLERLYGLATLTVHTAGTHNASVRLPGLLHADAIAMREAIRAHIRRETV